MASSYALPSSPLPHAHRNPLHSHTHAHAHSTTSQSPPSKRSFRGSMSNGSLHSHSQSEAQARQQNGHALHNHDRLSSNGTNDLMRERMPPPDIQVPNGWKEEFTAGGRKIMTPSATSTSFPSPFKSARSLHDHGYGHDHDHGHDHGHENGHAHDHAHDHGCGHSHDHGHNQGLAHSYPQSHDHGHGHGHSSERSAFTRYLLKYTASWPFLHAIMTEKDSRRILYYLLLNVSFMMVQAFYGYVTDSLGLLSDTVHMFFDCVALVVGLVAAVVSKWPPSHRFPYGLGKMETLSGFANGILLILLSVEITFEAFERLYEGSMPKRLGELLIVSVLGMLVNLVGVFAFGHHHHGHSHDHGHDHGHSHEKEDSHGHSHSHDHSHDNENMHGIYLHVLADTLGSASVVVSTILTSIWGWAGWDPLASVFISVLIILSSKPLIVSSAKQLLLTVPDRVEYNLRNVLAGISQQRGVVGCAAPKFWIDDRSGSDGGDRLLGIVHVVAARGASLDDVRQRVREFLLGNGMDVTVQVEREGDGSCWCGAGRTPSTPMMKAF